MAGKRCITRVMLRVLVDASSLCLPLLAGLAVYALWLRIGQYGLTPDRVVAVGATLVALLHALALMAAVLRRRDGWLAACAGATRCWRWFRWLCCCSCICHR